ncbi:MAG: helix-turn-helix domain-containing protein [Phycisphaerae bacterium]|nr:helix-turn-helix domain-containing protein [Phycisphaerae bacterium]
MPRTQSGKLPGQKVGRHWRFHKEAVEYWLKRHPTAPAGSSAAFPGSGPSPLCFVVASRRVRPPSPSGYGVTSRR